MSPRALVALLRFVWRHPLNRADRLGALARVARWQLGSRLLPGPVAVPFVGAARLVLERGMSGARMLVDVLAPMAEGSTISFVPIHAELTTQQAGGFPGVSPPHLVKRVEQRLLPHHKLGTRRRICFRDLLEYCKTRMAQSQAVLEALAEQTQKLNLGS